MNNHSQTNGVDIFSTENIKRCEKYISSIQRKLDEVVADIIVKATCGESCTRGLSGAGEW